MKVVGVVHGYNKNTPPGFRPYEPVVRDRVGHGLKVAEFFLNLGAEYKLVFSGGYTYSENESEAEGMLNFARNNFGRKLDELENRGLEILLEEKSRNTAENVRNIIGIARDTNADAITLVTSMDHSARAMYNLAYAEERNGFLVFGAPSNENYSIGGNKPVVIEPPYWAYPVAMNLFKVPVDKRDYVREVIESVIS